MERLFSFWSNYVTVSSTARAFMEKHAQVKTYPRGEHFMRPGERQPYWCLVLEGMACGYTLDESGRQHIHWFALPMQGFTGTRHLYTQAAQPLYIHFPQATQLLLLSAFKAREGKERFPELSELMHVLKQQFTKRNNLLISILQEPNINHRYASFVQKLPKIEKTISPAQQMAFINISPRSFFRARKHYLKNYRKRH